MKLLAALAVLAAAGPALAQPAAAPPAAPAAMPRLTLASPYDPNNVLARTIRGEVPAAKVYEDDHVLAVIDDEPGHFVVMSKVSEARNVLEIEPEEYSRMSLVVQKIARAEVAALGAQGFLIRTNAGNQGGVAQFHIHGYPYDPPTRAGMPKPTAAQLEPVAARIRAAIN